MRILFTILIASTLISADTKDINQKINQNESALMESKKKASQISKKLQELGEAINQQEKESKELEKTIQISEENIAKNQKEYDIKSAQMQSLSTSQDSLFQIRKNIELEMIDLIVKEISFVILLNDFQPESIQDLITEESFKTLSDTAKIHLKQLSEKQSKTLETLKNLQNEIDKLKNFIDIENKKRVQLKELQNKQAALIANYQKEITQYNDALQKIAKERDALQNILANLNILKKQEAQKAKSQKQNTESQKVAQAKDSTPKTDSKAQETKADIPPKSATKPSIESPIPSSDGFDVRQVASSYHDISTTKYKGAKTIAPLDNFSIEKYFGPYFDPVYKMKVFNESITLMPKGDDKVKSVLDGKVVFAKDTPILKRVVIIEHKDNMHTIYAQLDKIAPTIKPGRAVKKGYTIGRVDNALKFEVTLKDKHIDPLELINTKNI